jgi:D-beta-D-heptose 7-phosphate kinase/D-beta-D-heptose 1-phosphate adenosyltransferase
MLDRYIVGETARISPEADVPVLRPRSSTAYPGGCGNVARNVASLGGHATIVGLVGSDRTGEQLAALLNATPGVTSSLVTSERRPTTCKTRFLSQRRQVMRLDEEVVHIASPEEEDALLERIIEALAQVQAVIVSDYAKGVLSRRVLAFTIEQARSRSLPIFVDPKGADFSRYRGATCITPNQRELAAETGMRICTEASLRAAAEQLIKTTSAEAILVTRSERGMTLVTARGQAYSTPANARHVCDVTGAGDTAIAAFALAYVAGEGLERSVRIANAASGVVVGKLGTSTAQAEEVGQALRSAKIHRGQTGVVALDEAITLVEHWRAGGLTVGFTNGCFDLLHAGHVALIAEARARCDRLLVALNSDDSIARLKGPGRPVNSLAARAAVMRSLRDVDCVVSFAEDNPRALIGRLLPDILFKGADYSLEQVVGREIVERNGGRVVLIDLVPDHSTTGIIQCIDRSQRYRQRQRPAYELVARDMTA